MPDPVADPDTAELDAGEFGSWLTGIMGIIAVPEVADGQGSDVPCGTCTACCASSQFVHIAPDERDALAHIPGELLFAAPGAPRGHVLMGYDEQGRCPMLIEGACSIYEHRPRTCRAYDCRVFPAAGLEPTEPDKGAIAQRVRRWRFRFATPDDRVRRAAVGAAAAFVRARPELLPEGPGVLTDTQLAVLALEVHEAFLQRDDGALAPANPTTAEVRVEIDRVRRRRDT